MSNQPPPKPTNPNDPLLYYWDRPVSELVTVENTPISDGQKERHTIYSLLTLALAADAFNGNKSGAVGNYPWRTNQRIDDGSPVERGRYQGDAVGDRYLGHNIACIAVDAIGEIIDFEFNHNNLYNSSAEHAEARLVRRVFSLDQIADHWRTQEKETPGYSGLLTGVTLYTTLESCAQCSGIMALANVKSVVYLQSDPGQYQIGNILYNLSNPLGISHPETVVDHTKGVTKYGAPEPIDAMLIGFDLKARLDSGYKDFASAVAANPASRFFFQAPGKPADAAGSITSFLCTDNAKTIFDDAVAQLGSLSLTYGDFVPSDVVAGGTALRNDIVLRHALAFRAYVQNRGRRGTPHR